MKIPPKIPQRFNPQGGKVFSAGNINKGDTSDTGAESLKLAANYGGKVKDTA
jgi:hypothetical protein